MARKRKIPAKKAKTILKDGTVRGHKLTAAQRRLFGWAAGGSKPVKKKR